MYGTVMASLSPTFMRCIGVFSFAPRCKEFSLLVPADTQGPGIRCHSQCPNTKHPPGPTCPTSSQSLNPNWWLLRLHVQREQLHSSSLYYAVCSREFSSISSSVSTQNRKLLSCKPTCFTVNDRLVRR